MQKDLIPVSRAMSYALRHDPSMYSLRLDNQGWTSVDELLTGLAEHGFNVDYAKLQKIVWENDKQRFALSPDGTRIRANQGHSVKVDLGLKPSLPPVVLYHGTQTRYVDSIRRKGLLAMNRNHVHLSADVETAIKVARRHGNSVTILTVQAERMNSAGYKFYKSENGVWLTEAVPYTYIRI